MKRFLILNLFIFRRRPHEKLEKRLYELKEKRLIASNLDLLFSDIMEDQYSPVRESNFQKWRSSGVGEDCLNKVREIYESSEVNQFSPKKDHRNFSDSDIDAIKQVLLKYIRIKKGN